MDFTVIPEILHQSDFEDERPRSLRQMSELLNVSYKALEHPLLKSWRGYEAIDPFINPLDLEYYRRFNRTIIERTITQGNYISQLEVDWGILTMKSKGIELSIEHVFSFWLAANKIVQSNEEEIRQDGVGILQFRLAGAGHLTAAITYFMDVCNNLIALTQKHYTQNQVAKIEKDEDKIRYLLRTKAALLQQKDQYNDNTFAEILNSVQIELDYYKELRSYNEISEELRVIVNNFLAEKNARISNHQLLAYLLQGNMERFCEELKTLVFQLFSYHDIGTNVPERVYHAFLLGFFNSFREDFQLESNKEAGTGRFDLLLSPNTQDYKGMIVEVKRSDTIDPAKVQEQLEEALDQIISNKYATELQKNGHRSFIGLAAVFFGKELFLKYRMYNVL
ncbi:MAG: PD-(D/E)XK nuclease domain-containing protein [Chitinophagaceae bacterium]